MSTNTTILLAAVIVGVAIVTATVIGSSRDDVEVPISDVPSTDSQARPDVQPGPGLRTVTPDDRLARLEHELEAARGEIRRLKGATPDTLAVDTPRSDADHAGLQVRFFELSDAYSDGTATEEQVTELLKMTKDKALMARVVADLTQRITENPADLDARMQLVEVQSAQVHSAESITERSMIRKGVQEQIGAILKQDPEHWDARYMRAVGISHSQRSPQGRANAIREFESLISLQQSQTAEPRFASTYAQLAEVHMAERNTAQARQAIQSGLARHPDSKELKDLLASLDAGS